MPASDFLRRFQPFAGRCHPVVPFQPGQDKILPLDFTAANKDLTSDIIGDTDRLASYIQSRLQAAGCLYGLGGYGEHRTLYAKSRHFDRSLNGTAEPAARRLHLGMDIWGKEGTRVMAPLPAIVHSFAFNNHDGDYGATIILSHNLDGLGFHTLYGHLSLNSLKNLQEGARIDKGTVFTEFGMRFENGNWPPHLHFQIIIDLGDWQGDYPGVCAQSEQASWLENCPDPDIILQMNRYIARADAPS